MCKIKRMHTNGVETLPVYRGTWITIKTWNNVSIFFLRYDYGDEFSQILF